MQTRNFDLALRDRLLSLLRLHSRTEIAHKTGESLANVSRYAKRTRMPARFCAALVQALGVNPAWLLAGEGTPYTADIAAGTQRMAGNLLELVEAMNAVTRMRLGSLAGKQNLKVLRELNDALVRYEDLREKLNVHSRAIFSRMIADLQGALNRMDLERAVEIRKAARQVARLSEDEALLSEFARLQAHVEFLSRNYDRALEFQRQVFLQSVLARRPLAESDFEELARHALTLGQMLRYREGLTILDIAIRLLEENSGFAIARWMRFLRGQLLVDLGDLRGGLAAMLEHYPCLGGKRKAAAEASLIRAFLAAGTMSLEQAMAFGADIETKSHNLINHAICTENVPALKAVLAYHASERVAKVVRPGAAPGKSAARLLRAAGGDASALAEHAAQYQREAKSFLHPTARASWLIDLCQLARLCGRSRKAREYFDAASSALAEIGSQYTLPFTIEAVHWRSALELDRNTSTARAWFAAKVAAGFAMFAGSLSPA